MTKIDPSGSRLIYSTYLGGSGYDGNVAGYAFVFGPTPSIAIDTSMNVYVTGYTYSVDFPTVSPIQGANAGYSDAFVTKIDASGSRLIYSTYLGGSGYEGGYGYGGGGGSGSGIAVDTSGNAYIIGTTRSTDFPTVSPIQGVNKGVDAFVSKISASGSNLIYSTYLGGGGDYGTGIAIDSSGNAYITGTTYSIYFPTVNPIQGNNAGIGDAFVAKINASGSSLVYSTYIGGSGYEFGTGIAVDTFGNAYITGTTSSTDFPTAAPIQGICGDCPSSYDVFVTKINATGTSLVYSTYLGGSQADYGAGIAVDSLGNAYITGYATSVDFPTVLSTQGYKSAGDAFVTKINASGTRFIYSTYLGGGGYDWGDSIAVDSSGNAYITGTTYSGDFPTDSPIQGSHAGDYKDAFVVKIKKHGK